MRRSLRLLTVLVIVFVFAAGLLGSVVFVQRVLADPGSDVAWVGVVRSLALLVIGVVLTLRGRRALPALVEAMDLHAAVGPLRPLTIVVWAFLGATIYSTLRGWTVIVPVAAVVGAVVIGLPFVERFLDRVLARQAAQADAEAATPVAPVAPAGTAADA
ncbi:MULTISPECIES: hypothetical protein [Curtobacterium]|uniref:hypothetical protein n=1 Tax=Curtobacterium TaxID=2034 RepID=UPI0006F9DF92|nr:MULTISPECIES: hypothetical protein [Curtobacterium]KQR34437.1 hypothetical protein ASF75_01215 [Curtobacterium sp. Leaf154]MCS6575406.1 hypothetical protein [Curtobacterium flaccumfaciens pv. flaccumfaciens]OII06041.1 hypothetical protein BIU95_13945 [Curtobacterium sp. MCBA15_007]VXA91044.1 conserved membrane hypothetical protein [Curtobacterium sp. 8I-2]